MQFLLYGPGVCYSFHLILQVSTCTKTRKENNFFFKFFLACLVAVYTLQAIARASDGEQFIWQWWVLKKAHCGFFWGNTCFWLTSDLPDKILYFQKKLELQYCVGAPTPVACYCLKLHCVSSEVRSGLELYYGSNPGRLVDAMERQAIVNHRGHHSQEYRSGYGRRNYLFTGNLEDHIMVGLCTLILN